MICVSTTQYRHLTRRYSDRYAILKPVFASSTVAQPPASFSITVKLFAAYQDVVGNEEQTLEVTAGTTASDVCKQLIAQYPQLAGWEHQTRFGINLDFVNPKTELQPGDELVLIPPVSGG